MPRGSDSTHPDSSHTLRIPHRLTYREAPNLLQHFKKLARQPAGSPVAVDVADLRQLDSAGAACLSHGVDLLQRQGHDVQLDQLRADHRQALEMVSRAPHPEAQPQQLGGLASIGRWAEHKARVLREFTLFALHSFRETVTWLRSPRRFRANALVDQAVVIGVDAVFIVGLLGLLIGLVLAFQAVFQLRKLGAEIYMAELVGLGMTREFGSMMTGIVLAGRSGAAMAAELGTMKVNEEIEALQTMGLDPVNLLVVPRLMAISIVTPLLTLLAMAIGIGAGLSIAPLVDVPAHAVFERMQEVVHFDDFALGLLKSLLFAWVIGLMGCFMGLATRGGAHSVGTNTTRAVVASLVLIIFVDSVVTTVWTVSGV